MYVVRSGIAGPASCHSTTCFPHVQCCYYRSLKMLVTSLLICGLSITYALPIVDQGVFVIMGVKSCRDGSGYCLLGLDCTMDEDFLPDDKGGHCDGLRSAFTPSAHFICCRYNSALDSPPSPLLNDTALILDNHLIDGSKLMPATLLPIDSENMIQKTTAGDTNSEEDTTETKQLTTESHKLATTNAEDIPKNILEENFLDLIQVKSSSKSADSSPSIAILTDKEILVHLPSVTEINLELLVHDDIHERSVSTEKAQVDTEESTTSAATDTTTTADLSDLCSQDGGCRQDDFTYDVNTSTMQVSNMVDETTLPLQDVEESTTVISQELTTAELYPSTGNVKQNLNLEGRLADESTLPQKDVKEPTTLVSQELTTTELYSTIGNVKLNLNLEGRLGVETILPQKDVEESTAVDLQELTTTELYPTTGNVKQNINLEGRLADKAEETYTDKNDSERVTEAVTPRDSTAMPTFEDFSESDSVEEQNSQSTLNTNADTIEDDMMPSSVKISNNNFTTELTIGGAADVATTEPIRINEILEDQEDSKIQDNAMAKDCTGTADKSCWLVKFMNDTDVMCMGSLLKNNIILTAANCVARIFDLGVRAVKLQTMDGTELPQDLIRDVIVHEEYKTKLVEVALNDIGMVRLESPLKMSPSVCTLALPTSESVLMDKPCNSDTKKCSNKKSLELAGSPMVCHGSILGGVISLYDSEPVYTPVSDYLPWISQNMEIINIPLEWQR